MIWQVMLADSGYVQLQREPSAHVQREQEDPQLQNHLCWKDILQRNYQAYIIVRMEHLVSSEIKREPKMLLNPQQKGIAKKSF